RRLHQLRLVLEDLVEDPAIHVELRVADLLNAALDVRIDGARAALRSRGGVVCLGGLLFRGARRGLLHEHQALTERPPFEPHGGARLEGVETDVSDLALTHRIADTTQRGVAVSRPLN